MQSSRTRLVRGHSLPPNPLPPSLTPALPKSLSCSHKHVGEPAQCGGSSREPGPGRTCPSSLPASSPGSRVQKGAAVSFPDSPSVQLHGRPSDLPSGSGCSGRAKAAFLPGLGKGSSLASPVMRHSSETGPKSSGEGASTVKEHTNRHWPQDPFKIPQQRDSPKPFHSPIPV